MTAYTSPVKNQALKVLKHIFFQRGQEKPRQSGAELLFSISIGLIVIAMSGFLVVKGKLANLVIHGTVKVEDIGVVVIRKGLTSFRPAWCVGSGLRPVIVAKLCFLIFFSFHHGNIENIFYK